MFPCILLRTLLIDVKDTFALRYEFQTIFIFYVFYIKMFLTQPININGYLLIINVENFNMIQIIVNIGDKIIIQRMVNDNYK